MVAYNPAEALDDARKGWLCAPEKPSLVPAGDPNSVFVQTTASSGFGIDRAFHLAVLC